MNTELKSVLAVIFALGKLGKDVIEKAPLTQEVADLEAAAIAIPAVISNAPSLQSEIQALSQPANEADIIAFIISQFAGVSSDAHAQAILAASLKLIADVAVGGIALAAAIKG
jgi:hypothetical protein